MRARHICWWTRSPISAFTALLMYVNVRQIVPCRQSLGIDQAAVSRRLRGRTEWKVSELLTVAGLLGIHPLELIPTQTGPDGPGGTNGAVDAPTVSTRCSSQAAA